MPKILKPIEAEDIALYQIPSGLKYSPDGRRLAFQVTRADADKNLYHTDVWLAEGGKARRMTWSIDAQVVLWDDDETLIVSRTLPDSRQLEEAVVAPLRQRIDNKKNNRK
jgi:dipeptidyl aminopeptidase/acylaminoacyl peptidase